MPFSFFAARCIYVAKQPLVYRQNVIKRIFAARVTGHVALFSTVKIPDLVTSGFTLIA